MKKKNHYTIYNQNNDEVLQVYNPSSCYIQDGKHWFAAESGTTTSFDTVEYRVVKTPD